MLLHPLLAGRWSPTSFDATYDLPDREIEALLEAARWAPSVGNSQPWALIVGRRGDDTHGRLVSHLADSSAAWAPRASLLIANLAAAPQMAPSAGSTGSSASSATARPWELYRRRSMPAAVVWGGGGLGRGHR